MIRLLLSGMLSLSLSILARPAEPRPEPGVIEVPMPVATETPFVDEPPVVEDPQPSAAASVAATQPANAPADAMPPATTASPTESPTPAPSPSPTPSTAPSGKPEPAALVPDEAFGLLGTWKCETFVNWHGQQVYAAAGPDRIVLHNELRSPGGSTYRIVQWFRFDPARGRWSTYVEGGDFKAGGGVWTGDRWTLTGVWRGVDGPARLTYTALGRAAFRRDFQARRSGGWHTFAAETCSRPGTDGQ